MTVFDVATHLAGNPYKDDTVTEAPETLTVLHMGMYYLEPLMDDASLLWVYLTSETFDEFLPGYDWSVDNPGTLYPQTTPSGDDPDEDEPVVPISEMQTVADELLNRYRAVVEYLRAQGREILPA